MKRPGAVLLLAALLAVNAHASGWAAGAVARAATALGGRDRIEMCIRDSSHHTKLVCMRCGMAAEK